MLKLEQTEKILRGLVDAGVDGKLRAACPPRQRKGGDYRQKMWMRIPCLRWPADPGDGNGASLAMMSIAEGKLALEDHLGDFSPG